MPKKTTKQQVQATPSQGQVARLLSDSLGLMSQEVVQALLQNQEKLGIDLSTLKEIRELITSSEVSVKSKATDQLLKYY